MATIILILAGESGSPVTVRWGEDDDRDEGEELGDSVDEICGDGEDAGNSVDDGCAWDVGWVESIKVQK
jgi:hypothetical protein